MIEKYATIDAFDPVHGQNVFVFLPGEEMEKTASLLKEAQISDKLAQAIESLRREPGHAYVLVNAMGAGEYWSSNRNGDYWPEGGLKHAGDEYGYETFLSGHNFVHHQNKDPKRAVGTVKCAYYNDRMHRVELLIDTDLEKLRAADPDLHEKVAAGEPVDVSMGSKCDYDICSICSNKAATRAEYCSHLKTAMNQILADGRKVYAYTPHPRFFDISYVTKGADVTAKALHYLDKKASDGEATQSGGADEGPRPAPSREKAAFAAPTFPERDLYVVGRLVALEREIPAETLAKLASIGYHKALSTASHLGIVLRPEEYQYLTLSALGHKEAADRMAAAGAVVDLEGAPSWLEPSVEVVPQQFASANWSAKAAAVLAEHVPHRSILEPYLSERVKKAMLLPAGKVASFAEDRALRKEAGRFLTPEMAAAMALGYVIYRKGIPRADIGKLKQALHDPATAKKVVPVLVALIAAGSVVDKTLSFEPMTGAKTAGFGAEVALPVAGTYLYSAHARRKAERGEPLSTPEIVAGRHPLATSLGLVAGIQALKRKFKGTVKKSSAKITGVTPEEKSAGVEQAILALGSGIYRPRASGLLGYLADTAILTGIVKGVGKLTKGKKEN